MTYIMHVVLHIHIWTRKGEWYLTKVPWTSCLEAQGPNISLARRHPKTEVVFALTLFPTFSPDAILCAIIY